MMQRLQKNINFLIQLSKTYRKLRCKQRENKNCAGHRQYAGIRTEWDAKNVGKFPVI